MHNELIQYMQIHTYMYICMCIYVHVDIYMSKYVFTYAYAFVHITCMCTYAYTHAYAYTHTFLLYRCSMIIRIGNVCIHTCRCIQTYIDYTHVHTVVTAGRNLYRFTMELQ